MEGLRKLVECSLEFWEFVERVFCLVIGVIVVVMALFSVIVTLTALCKILG